MFAKREGPRAHECRGSKRGQMRIMAALLVTLSASPLPAQWLNYPTPGIPRTAEGKPNLSAPAPRTADGKPDLSGVWDMDDKVPCPQEGCSCVVAQQFLIEGLLLAPFGGIAGLVLAFALAPPLFRLLIGPGPPR